MKQASCVLHRHWLPVLTALLVIWQTALLCSVRILPMVDIPFHLLSGTVIRDWADPAVSFREYYALPSNGPNLFHLWFISRSVFPSVEAANLLYYVVTFVLLPVSASMVIAKNGGVWQLGGLAALLAYHFSSVWGFAGYTLAVPLSLICVSLLADLLRKFRIRDALCLASALVLLFFTHGQMAMFMAIVLACTVLYLTVTHTRGSLLVAASTVPLLIAVVAWSAQAEASSKVSTVEYLLTYYREEYLSTLPDRALWPVLDLIQLTESRSRAYGGAILMIAPIAAVVWAMARSMLERLEWKKPPATLVAPLVYTFGALVAWNILPANLPAQAFVYQRYSVLAVLGVLILASVKATPRILESRLFAAVSLIAVVTCMISSWSYYADWRTVSDPVRPSLFPAERDKRVAAMICDPMFRRLPLFLHVASYQTVWKRGIAATSVIDFRFGSLRRVASLEKLPAAEVWLCYEGHYAGQFAQLEYLLLRDTGDRPLGREIHGTLVREDRGWRLYRQAP